jgi:hypothetical protein
MLWNRNFKLKFFDNSIELSNLVQDVELFLNEYDSMKFAKYTIRFGFITIACKFGDLSEEKKQEIFFNTIKV